MTTRTKACTIAAAIGFVAASAAGEDTVVATERLSDPPDTDLPTVTAGSWFAIDGDHSTTGPQDANNDRSRGGVSTFTNGDPLGSNPNTLQLAGRSTFSTVLEGEFTIGQLLYLNAPVVEGTEIDAVDTTIALEFDAPSALAGEVITVDFTLNLTGNDASDNDLLSFEYDGPPTVFTVANTEYTLSIGGFRDLSTGSFITELDVPSGSVAEADIIATLTSDVPGELNPIPLPGPAALGFAGVAAVAIRRSRN